MLGELNVDVAFDMLNPFVLDHMAQVTGERIVGINNFTREIIRGELIDGMQAGEGFRDLAARLRGQFDWMDRARSQTIARTEVVRSSSFASVEAYSQSGIVEVKRWIVTPDGERHDSLGYGGVVADIRSPFQFDDGFSAPYPGEFGIAWQDINCRCAVAPVVEGPDAPSRELQDQMWKAQDAERRSWENNAREAYRRGFRAQERDALEELRRQAT